MEALWNKKCLEHPANNIWITSVNKIDLKGFSSTLENACKELDSQSMFHTEAAILSRLIYRMKSKFRNDKGLKNMEKVNRALLNYLEIKLEKEFKDLRNYIESDGPVVNLPTRQMLEYLLVRIQGFAKLMARVESVAKLSAEFWNVRISIGHAWIMSVIALAVVSRIWFLSRYILKRSCVWYNSLRKYVEAFERVGPAWLPQDYRLPEDLKDWLDLPWIDKVSDSVPLKDDGKKTIFGLIKGHIDDTFDKNFDEEEEEKEEEEIEEKRTEKTIGDDFYNEILTGISEDIGVTVKREAYASDRGERIGRAENFLKRNTEKAFERRGFEKSEGDNLLEERINRGGLKPRKGKQKGKLRTTSGPLGVNKNSNPSVEIKTKDDLKKFLNDESRAGLDKLQWDMMVKSIKKFIIKLDKCSGPSDEKLERRLFKKLNRTVQNWIQ